MAKNIIKLNRGDSYEFTLSIPNKYILTNNDIICFALLYPHQRFEEAILIKGYDYADLTDENGVKADEILIKIEPKDTEDLAPGIYYYTVKLLRGNTSDSMDILNNPVEARTIIERTKFIIND